MTGCDAIRMDLGAYALGLLDEDERRIVAVHVAECADCRAEVDELRATSSLLNPDALGNPGDASRSPDSGRAFAAIANARRRERRSVRGAVGALALPAVVSATLGAMLTTRTGDAFAPTGPTVALRSMPGVATSSTMRLTSRPWGTQIDLRADRLPTVAPGTRYEVWLIRRDGTHVPAGSFRPASAEATSRVRLASGVARSDVAAVGVSRIGGGNDEAVLRADIA